MPDALQDLARRRGALLARSAALRNEFAGSAEVLRAPLDTADRIRDGLHWVRAHPYLLLGGAAAILVARPRRALAFSLKVWGAWRICRQVMAALRD